MIKTHSDDPDVAAAADAAYDIIVETLHNLPEASSYDYGGHQLSISDYDLCDDCTRAIAEAQQAEAALKTVAKDLTDSTIAEHVELAAMLFATEAQAAVIRAEFHNGQNTEKILNQVLGYLYERKIQDRYQHSHKQGA